MSEHHEPIQNHLLKALSPAGRERLYPQLEPVAMPLGKVLYESGDVLRHVYFPSDSIVSLLYVMEDGASAEIAVVGNEGLIGVALFMGGETTTSRAIVQSAGNAYRLAGQQPQEVGLPRPVGAEHRHPLAEEDLQVERAHQAGQLEALAGDRARPGSAAAQPHLDVLLAGRLGRRARLLEHPQPGLRGGVA